MDDKPNECRCLQTGVAHDTIKQLAFCHVLSLSVESKLTSICQEEKGLVTLKEGSLLEHGWQKLQSKECSTLSVPVETMTKVTVHFDLWKRYKFAGNSGTKVLVH